MPHEGLLTHDGKRDPAADIALHDRLLGAGHMSPFEHQARPLQSGDDCMVEKIGSSAGWWSGNFRGWKQYRKTLAGEADILGADHG